ncbi:hypothetical protein PUN28_004120 [Cardiocondyla obscurior]|uniref:Uncharacterized protein n=1 Tax=Cardiocondyla obscurior TaxID=286306 RepID=A0AAW2GPN5_9HYME
MLQRGFGSRYFRAHTTLHVSRHSIDFERNVGVSAIFNKYRRLNCNYNDYICHRKSDILYSLFDAFMNNESKMSNEEGFRVHLRCIFVFHCCWKSIAVVVAVENFYLYSPTYSSPSFPLVYFRPGCICALLFPVARAVSLHILHTSLNHISLPVNNYFFSFLPRFP